MTLHSTQHWLNAALHTALHSTWSTWSTSLPKVSCGATTSDCSCRDRDHFSSIYRELKLHMEWSSQSSLKKITFKMRIQILYKPSLSLSFSYTYKCLHVYLCMCVYCFQNTNRVYCPYFLCCLELDVILKRKTKLKFKSRHPDLSQWFGQHL